jgi:hypothetical protein
MMRRSESKDATVNMTLGFIGRFRSVMVHLWVNHTSGPRNGFSRMDASCIASYAVLGAYNLNADEEPFVRALRMKQPREPLP